MFNYFLEKKLFAESQSDFILVVSCVAHLLSSTYEIHKVLTATQRLILKKDF